MPTSLKSKIVERADSLLPRGFWPEPEDMITAPKLGPLPPRKLAQARYALLINPFYRKDPRASYGKHVLTPSCCRR